MGYTRKTYQDFENARNQGENAMLQFIKSAISEHKSRNLYQQAIDAELYDRGENVTIRMVQKFLYNTSGQQYVDIYAANNKIANNIFSHLITQQNEYSLANGVNFDNAEIDEKIANINKNFDTQIKDIARYALRDGRAYGYFDGRNINAFEYKEFVAFKDENTGKLRAGVRFYQIDKDKPINLWLYEEDGLTHYRTLNLHGNDFETIEPKKSYITILKGTDADGMIPVESKNYSSLPVYELRANSYGQSELNAIRDKIDAYDLTLSGLANDIDENAFIYWIIQNAGGMEDADIARFKQALRTAKVAEIDATDGSSVEQFQKDVPTEARTAMLDRLKQDIYETYGAFNPAVLSAGNLTATQINAAYTVVDNKASQFEKQITEFVQNILLLMEIQTEDYKIRYIRNRLVNAAEEAQTERTKIETLLLLSNYLDDKTLIEAVKTIIPELSDIDVEELIKKKSLQDDEGFGATGNEGDNRPAIEQTEGNAPNGNEGNLNNEA